MNDNDQLLSPPWCVEFNFRLESVFTKLTIRENLQSSAQPTERTIHLKDVFMTDRYGKKSRTVLIEGKPGIGKTTYCQKLAFDWAKQLEESEKFLSQIQVLLSLKCRDISSDIWTAIDSQLLPEDVDEQSKEWFFKFIRENQSKVLMILDGLDDMPPDKLQMISKLVGRELPQCHFLLTAEPATAMKVQEYCDAQLSIVGFTEQDAREFISKYFEDQEHLAKKLFELLDKFDNLRKEVVPGNPVYTALLCLLCKDLNGVFPTSIAKLYIEVILCALRRFENVKGKSSSSEDLIEVYKDQLMRLGLIAFNYQCKGDSDLEEDELHFDIGDLPEFGFISTQTTNGTRRPRLWYGFEKFFAGFYLASQIISGEIKLDSIIADQIYFNNLGLRQVFLYMSGILALQSEEKALDLAKGICSRINSLRLGNADEIKELQQLLLLALECREYDSEHKDNFNSRLSLTLGSALKLETFTLGRPFGHSYTIKDLLELNAFTSSWYKGNFYRGSRPLMAGLFRPFSEALKSNTTLSTLLLSRNEIEPSGVKALSSALKVNSTLTNLDLSENKIGSSGALDLADALQINTALTKLDLSDNEIDAKGIQSLSEALKSNASLTTLNLHRNKIGEKKKEFCPREISPCIDIRMGKSRAEALKRLHDFSNMDKTRSSYGLFSLSECLKINTTLTNLNLAGNGIDSVGAYYLSEGLKTNTSLTTLDLALNHVGRLGANCLSLSLGMNTNLTSLNVSATGFDGQAVSDTLRGNATLRKLDVRSNEMGEACTQYISRALAYNSTLTSLDASRNKIDATGTQHISEALVQNRTLTSLDLSHNPLGGVGALFLSEALQQNDTLTELNLKFTEVDERGATFLFDALKYNKSLSSLDFTDNCIAWSQLSDALKFNASSLTSLKLSKNAMSAFDAEDFFEALTVNETLKELELEKMKQPVNFPAEVLTSNTALTHLNLSSSHLTDLGSIFEALKVNSTMTRLELNSVEIGEERSHIGDSECQFISETLKVNATLTDLDLSSNSIGAVGIQCMSEALKINKTLKYLDLSGQQGNYDPNSQPLWDALKVNTTVFVLL